MCATISAFTRSPLRPGDSSCAASRAPTERNDDERHRRTSQGPPVSLGGGTSYTWLVLVGLKPTARSAPRLGDQETRYSNRSFSRLIGRSKAYHDRAATAIATAL